MQQRIKTIATAAAIIVVLGYGGAAVYMAWQDMVIWSMNLSSHDRT